jgi:hypothetical protein
MGKYFRSFEELKLAFVSKKLGEDGVVIDVIDDDKDAAEDYSRRSRFGRNPESNVIEYERRSHDHSRFDDWIAIFINNEGK